MMDDLCACAVCGGVCSYLAACVNAWCVCVRCWVLCACVCVLYCLGSAECDGCVMRCIHVYAGGK